MSKITNDWLNPVWHRMLYSCTRMATMGVRGFITLVVWAPNISDIDSECPYGRLVYD